MKYDLEERTTKFAESIIDFCKLIKRNPINLSLISQLIRSGTSVGANYREAIGAVSRNDFKNKIHICRKEAQETDYWIRMTTKANPELTEMAVNVAKETKELVLIFNKISITLKQNPN